MKLYLISNRSHTSYDAAVVAAETMEEARLTHPEGYRWDAARNEWVHSGWWAMRVREWLVGTSDRSARQRDRRGKGDATRWCDPRLVHSSILVRSGAS